MTDTLILFETHVLDDSTEQEKKALINKDKVMNRQRYHTEQNVLTSRLNIMTSELCRIVSPTVHYSRRLLRRSAKVV